MIAERALRGLPVVDPVTGKEIMLRNPFTEAPALIQPTRNQPLPPAEFAARRQAEMRAKIEKRQAELAAMAVRPAPAQRRVG
ncbi:MAG: hypothetical protein L0220_14180 [Acidobacteria bacterium]|nr:hypothetical protein [Acidobacteriota bacterium]